MAVRYGYRIVDQLVTKAPWESKEGREEVLQEIPNELRASYRTRPGCASPGPVVSRGESVTSLRRDHPGLRLLRTQVLEEQVRV
jgi:hypothetical protein